MNNEEAEKTVKVIKEYLEDKKNGGTQMTIEYKSHKFENPELLYYSKPSRPNEFPKSINCGHPATARFVAWFLEKVFKWRRLNRC